MTETETETNLPTIRFDPAYSGGLLHLDPRQWPYPVVFDIDGLEERPQVVPIVRDHEQGRPIGETIKIEYDGGRITADGRVLNYGIDADANNIVELAKRGAHLQASVATCLINDSDVEFVEAGKDARANKRAFAGPVEIVRKWRLKEISVVTIGADDDGAHVAIEAANVGGDFYAPRNRTNGGTMKTFEWNKFLNGLGMSRKAAANTAARIGRAADGEPTADDVLEAIKKETEAQAKSAKAKSAKAEEPSETDEEKRALCAFAEEIGAGDPEEMSDAEKEILKAAFARYGKAEEPTDEEIKKKEDDAANIATARSGAAAWSRTKYPVELLGSQTRTIKGGASRPSAARIAEAALFTANGTDGRTLERLGYTQAEIDEAQRAENRTLSLRGLIYRTGEAKAGYTDEGKIGEVLQKASYLAKRQAYEPGYRSARAAGELSTVDIPNVLANVVNKSMLNGVLAVEDPTDTISRVVAAKDFRPQFFINLLTSGEMQPVKPNGELENLKLTDAQYANSASMRGFEVRIDYETIANDDMNAVQEIPRIMGRKAALKKQRLFFEAFTSAADLPGVTSNPVLNLNGVDKGCAAFRALKDGDADPIGAKPRFLIVPPALEATALNLVMASEIVSGGTGENTALSIVPNVKRYASRFEVVTSEYLGADSAFAAKWGDKKWMLLADPQEIPLMIISYYQNQKQPTIKTVYGDTEIDGLRYVLYWGFGVSVAEKKSCVVSTPS